MDIQGIAVEDVALDGIGRGDDDGEAGNQLDGLTDDILHGSIIGIVIVGV